MAADRPSDSSTLGVREAASALGLKPHQLKNAISAGLLRPPRSGIAGGAFAVAGFDDDWLKDALSAVAERPREIRDTPYTPAPRPIIKAPPAPGVKELDPDSIKPPKPWPRPSAPDDSGSVD